MHYCIVESQTWFILPRKPSVNLRLRPVGHSEWSTLAFRSRNAPAGQFEQRTRRFRNQSDKPVLNHSFQAIVRHDPDAEPWATRMKDLQAFCRNLVRQIRELAVAPCFEIVLTSAGVTVRIDSDPQSFESRGSQFGLNDSRLQDLVDAPERISEYRGLGRIRPRDTVRFHQAGDHAAVRVALHEQLPGRVRSGQLTEPLCPARLRRG